MPRYLRRNHGTETPSNLIFFDTECYERDLDCKPRKRSLYLRLWCATRVRMDGDKVTRRCESHGYDAKSFWRFVFNNSDSHRCTWIFAHNLAFDLTQVEFWSALEDGTFTITPLYRRSKGTSNTSDIAWRGRIVAERNPCYFIVRAGRRTYKMVDTCNYWPKALSSLGESLGLGKLELPSMDAPNREWLERCRRDVQIIERAVLAMMENWRKEDCGTFKVTAAALSFTNFQHVCPFRTEDGKNVDIVTRPGCESHALERESYYGGRFQCYYVGAVEGDIYHVDCNGLYPFVMRNNNYPRRFVAFKYGVTHEELAAYLRCYDCCARVLISTRTQTFPVRIDGIQHHAFGEFYTTLCGPELLRAMEGNAIARIHLVQCYARAPIFRSWVDIWTARKRIAADHRDTDPGRYEFCKLILNSLSGKWAQHGRQWEDMPDRFPLEPWGGWPAYNNEEKRWERLRGLGRITQRLSEHREPDHAFPIISALIASYGREYMRTVINLCPENSVYYMATDSLIGNRDMVDALQRAGLIDQHELGAFKIVGRHRSLVIRCSNDYALDGKRTASGLLGKAIAMGRTDGYAETFESLPGLINNGPKRSVVVSEVRVRHGTPEYKGVIGKDGWWNPYCLMDLQCWFNQPPSGGYRRACLTDTLADRIRLDA